MGQGVAFCIQEKYSTQYLGARIKRLANKGIVIKNKKEGFTTPRMSTSCFTKDIVHAWHREPITLTGCTGVFRLANLSGDKKLSSSTKLPVNDLEQRQVSLAKTLEFRSPARIQRKVKEDKTSFVPHKIILWGKRALLLL